MSALIPFITTGSPERAALWRQKVADRLPGHQVVAPEDMSDADAAAARVAIVGNPDPETLARFTGLEWVQSVWAGVDKLIGRLPEDLRIARLVDPVLAETMAEGVLAHTLYLHRHVPAYLAQQRQRVWRPLDHPRASARTVAILGLGELGRAAAAVLTAAGFRVTGWSRSPREVPGVTCFSGADALPEVVAGADIIVVLLPLTDATRGMLDADMLAHCRPGAGIINVARGPIIDRDALMAALDDGRLGHAVLDVFDVEPLPADDAMWDHPAITMMPHVAAITDMDSASQIVADNLSAYFETGQMPTTIDAARGY
ncbi:glyoxylate/hydroxypyruvate reductase A [Acuticoccus sp. MNP-M23]|uniref:2-hydroxyacid dehydrogenase n=1 Tax=Acuticoccus sp. MNP-M23 TaxID=3072793 RepID=UPI0028161BE1|nr:glyoxylate/hydroxypyruvate reductase A [Acuticoccus sp. MNP-M23]WMS41425.1 glyoxylate/hydroxypyruvate reductase A [Acuticoccus sp. MNP-M23]